MFTLSIIIQSLLILVFLMTGGSMFAGAKLQIEAFNHLGLPQWFRIVTAIVQYVGVIGLIIGFWNPGAAAWAGIWLGITMLVGFLAHVRVHDPIGKAFPAFVLAVMAIALTFINAGGLLQP